MKSMTGYGEAARQRKGAKVLVQIRSLNHRHLDIQFRAPREYLPVEEEIRKLIRQRISRGRVELFVQRSALRPRSRKLELDENLLQQYVLSLRRAQKRFKLRGDINLSFFSSFPEIFQIREGEIDGEDEQALVLETLRAALGKLERSRMREGRQLKTDIQSHLRGLQRISAKLNKEAEGISDRIRETFSTKEGGTPAQPLNESPEAPSWNFKGAIHEEVVRLRSHVDELWRIVQERDPIGKKVDFMLQEVQRELNTISSKVPQLSVVQLVLAGKEQVEKIREQAQNIE